MGGVGRWWKVVGDGAAITEKRSAQLWPTSGAGQPPAHERRMASKKRPLVHERIMLLKMSCGMCGMRGWGGWTGGEACACVGGGGVLAHTPSCQR